MIIEINKDIENYQESVVMGLTPRQLVFSIGSVAVGGGIVLILYRYVGLTLAAYIAIPCVAPIAMGGFYSYNGMTFYEYIGRQFYFLFKNKTLTYISEESPAILEEYKEEQKRKQKKTQKSRNRTVKQKKEHNSANHILIGVVVMLLTGLFGSLLFGLLYFMQ